MYEQFSDAIRAAGLTPPSVIEAGKFYRFSGEGKRTGNRAGWCKLFPDGLAGVFGDFASGFSADWHAQREGAYTPAEIESFKRQAAEAKAQAEAERKARADEAAKQSALIWSKAAPSPGHAYCTAKGILMHLARMQFAHAPECKHWFWTTDDQGELIELTGKLLLLPLYSIGGELRGLQAIDELGRKSLIRGLDKRGLFIPLTGGKLASDYAGNLYIGEGFSTVATIRQATDQPAVAAIDAGNLLHVAEAWRKKLPSAEIIIAGDIDKSGTGQRAAMEAAHAVHGLVALPPFTDVELATDRPPSDWNDYAALHGLETVKQSIADAINSTAGEGQAGNENRTAGAYSRDVSLIRASDVTPEAIAWLWDGWLAAGKMHVFGGAPGTGKTTISMGLAATVTTGGRWPDGSRSVAGNVVIWSGEDDPADTLIPRLALSGADLSRVYFIADILEGNERRSFDPARDMEPLRRKLAEIGGVKLLIVDPVVSAIAGDSHKNAEVRRGLQPLVDLAGTMRCALLGITHFSKGTGGRDPVERLTGSLAFGALARVVLVAAKHQEEGDDGRTVRLFCRAKSNIGPDDGGFEYDLHQAELKTHPGIFASSVLWGAAVEGAARELLATADATGDDGEGGNLTDAKRFLADLLADGPMRAGEVFKDADQAGYSKRGIQRAANAIKVERHKDGMKGGWTWRLPPKMPSTPEDAVDARLKSLAPLAPSAESSLVEVEI